MNKASPHERESIDLDRYVSLSDNFNLRAAAAPSNKYIAYHCRSGISYDIDEAVYNLLLKCDGTKRIFELDKDIPSEMLNNYLNFLHETRIITFRKHPSNGFKTYQVNPTPYQGEFLRRIHWHLTSRCNLECKHCYVSSSINQEELNLEQIHDLIEQMANLTVVYVSLSGGEVFLRNDFIDVLKLLEKYRIGIKNINTNGTIVNMGIVKYLHEYFPDTPFFISVDGAVSESHDEFRRYPGAFKATLHGIKSILKEDTRVLVNTSLWSGNITEILELYAMMRDLKVAKWRVSQPFPMGRWSCTKAENSIPIEQEFEAYEKILDQWEHDGLPFEIELGSAFRIQFDDYNMERYTDTTFVCGYYRDSCSLLPSGKIIPCGALTDNTYVFGDICQQSLASIWMSPSMREFKNLSIQDCLQELANEQCKTCEWLYYCGMGCRVRAVHYCDSLTHYDPILCEYYKDKKIFSRFKAIYLRHAQQHETEIS